MKKADRDYYSILGAEDSDSRAEIERRYKRLAHRHHPDRGGDEEEMKALNEAWRVLGDPASRATYDARRARAAPYKGHTVVISPGAKADPVSGRIAGAIICVVLGLVLLLLVRAHYVMFLWPLALLAAAVRRLPPPGNAELSTRSEVPPGSGLGSSGALDVAMVAALLSARGEACGRMELAHRAWQVESVDVGIPGGKQDQYAAALGGFNRLRFGADEVAREPLVLDDGVRDALARATLLCYTGKSRLSGNTIARVIAAYERRESAVTGALFGIRETAERMAEALPSGDLARIGALLEANWKHQQSLDAAMRTAEMAELERAVRSAGGLGGKAAGAGAGGCMFFIVEDFTRAAAAARSVGSEVLPVTWDFEGVTAC
ncbi:MAG: DnaJ domain-containing protein [Gemmatimonadota bacterium]|nr:DnaJ domain-containing protein [Gemmatimonadota bacterium]